MAGKSKDDDNQKDLVPNNDTVEEELSPAAIAERSLRQDPKDVELPEQTAYSEN